MLRTSRFGLSLVALVLASGAAAYVLACGDSGSASGDSSADGDGGFTTLPDAAVGPTDPGSTSTTMRLAHLASDLGAVDFCYRTATTTSFEGPVLGGGLGVNQRDAAAADGEAGGSPAGDLDAGDGGEDEGGADAGAPSVTYRTVSRYLTLDMAGPLTIALVAPGATSCATPLFTADVTLDPGKLSTVAILGRQGAAADAGDESLSLVAFTDDRTTTAGKARARLIHAALGLTGGRPAAGPLAVRAAAAQTVTLADHVDPKKPAAPSTSVPVDALGYATIDALPAPASLAVGAADGTTVVPDASVESWVSAGADLGLSGASLHTGFILSGAVGPFEVLWCTDTETTGDRTACALLR